MPSAPDVSRRPTPVRASEVTTASWGPQEVAVRAYSGGSRGGAPYVAVARLVHSRTAARRRPHRRGHARAMTPTPPPVPTTVPGFVVLDAGLPDRLPLGHASDHDAALYVLSAAQEGGLRPARRQRPGRPHRSPRPGPDRRHRQARPALLLGHLQRHATGPAISSG